MSVFQYLKLAIGYFVCDYITEKHDGVTGEFWKDLRSNTIVEYEITDC